MRDAGPCGTTGDDGGFVNNISLNISHSTVCTGTLNTLDLYTAAVSIMRPLDLEPEPQGDLPRRAKGRSEPRELRITDADAIGSGLRPAKGIDDRRIRIRIAPSRPSRLEHLAASYT
jgi:hypothetical protein